MPMLMEIKTFLMLLAGGFFVSALYDLYRQLWFAKHRRSWTKHIGDIVFSLIASALIVMLLFYTNWCELRSYVFIGLALGIFTYYKVVNAILAYFR